MDVRKFTEYVKGLKTTGEWLGDGVKGKDVKVRWLNVSKDGKDEEEEEEEGGGKEEDMGVRMPWVSLSTIPKFVPWGKIIGEGRTNAVIVMGMDLTDPGEGERRTGGAKRQQKQCTTY